MLRGRRFRLEREDYVMSIGGMTCVFTVAVKCAWKTQVSDVNVSTGSSLIYGSEAGGGLRDNDNVVRHSEIRMEMRRKV